MIDEDMKECPNNAPEQANVARQPVRPSMVVGVCSEHVTTADEKSRTSEDVDEEEAARTAKPASDHGQLVPLSCEANVLFPLVVWRETCSVAVGEVVAVTLRQC